MNGMGTPKDIIMMLILIVGVIAMTAYISAMKIGERMDRSIESMNSKTKSKSKDDPQTLKYTAVAAITIAAGVALILILKQFDVINDTFFPKMKS